MRCLGMKGGLLNGLGSGLGIAVVVWMWLLAVKL